MADKVVVGIDIGSHSIKIVEISCNGREPAITRLSSKRLSSEISVEESLRQISRELKGREIVSAASETFVVSRSFTFPAMTGVEFEDFLRINYREYLPAQSRIEEVALDYQILRDETERGEETALVLIAACKKESIYEHVSLLRKAGLIPTLIDASSIPLFNAFYRHPAIQSGEQTAIINLGARKTNVLLIDERCIRSVTELPVGGNAITETLAKALNVNLEDAENLTRNPGDPPRTEILEAVNPALNAILSEIEKVFLYYQKSKGGRDNPGVIILCGGASGIVGLQEQLKAKFKADVEVGIPFEGLTLRIPFPDNPSCYALAVGLALKKIYPKINTINLLPPSHRDALDFFRGMNHLKNIVFRVSVGLLIALALISFLRLYFRASYRASDGKFRALQTDLDKTLALKAENEKLNAKLELIRSLSVEESPWSGILIRINRAVPKELWLTDIQTRGRLSSKMDTGKDEALSKSYDIRLTGLTYFGYRVKEVLASLTKDNYFKNVELSYLEKTKDVPGSGLIKFELRMDLTL